MGTRGLTCAVIDGEMKIAQYGQWDHYPSGVGLEVATFMEKLYANNELGQFKEAVRECKFIPYDEIVKQYKKKIPDYKEDDGWITIDMSEKLKQEFPQFHRDTGPEILALVMNGVRELQDSYSFGDDALFCEWAYIIDLDKDQILVFREGIGGGELTWETRKPYAKFPIKKAVAGINKAIAKYDRGRR